MRCLELDSRFAPAWARLGRCHRVIGKYIDGAPESNARAEDAFRRALSINPRLSIAHKYYANLEAEIGQTEGAMVRLLGEATRHGNDPELFSGLVHACRYCGLYEQSIAAHAEARRLDPNVPTGVEQTLLLAGEIDRMLAEKPPAIIAGADDGIRVVGLGLAGRRDEARTLLETMRLRSRLPTFVLWTDRLASWLDRRLELMGLSMIPGLKIRDDPEAIFQEGWMLCDIGDYEQGMFCLELAVSKGYLAAATLARSPQFDALRGDARFGEVLARAKAGRERALAAFRSSGGEALLGAVS
jgi:tetratricopeptide (TPR) repeat protein